MRVQRITPVTAGEPVFDLTVAGTHLYVVGGVRGVVVSNSKRIALLDTNALLSHGSTAVLRDAVTYRGQRNDELALQFMSGYTPREPRVPQRYEKFVAQLQAAGINVVRDGAQLNVMALTNRDVDQMAGDREVTNAETLHFDKGMRPVSGGLFDERLTGGNQGNRWAALRLHEPMPNPAFEEPIRRVLGLTEKRFEDIIAGTDELEGYGKGPQAIARALDQINLPRAIAQTRVMMNQGSRSARDAAARRLGYLKSASERDLHPRDWILSRVPILPPVFRPVALMGGKGLPIISDPNYLYKELFEANRNLQDAERDLGPHEVGPERLALYHAFRAVAGLGDPITAKSQEKGVKGILRSVFGSSPKFGTLQRKLISTTVDNVGRAVIVPNPDFDMDTVGIPEQKAFDVYSKFVARRLKRRGLPLTEALQQIDDRTDLARKALLEEMEARPVLINRAPVLHKFGIMAFRPRLVTGNVVQFSPLIYKGFGADNDGDAVQWHVPFSDDAAQEALERMLPSRNLLSPADFKSPVAVPGQEYQGGLWALTADRAKKDKSGRPSRPGRRPRVFRNKHDALAAWERGDVSHDDEVEILED